MTTDASFLKNRFLDALIEQRRGADGELNWEHAPPYVLRHAVQHAAEVDRVDDLLVDPELLSCADPAGVVPNLDRVSTEAALYTTAVYRASLHRHRSTDANTRRDLLALDATRLGIRDFGDRLAARSHSRWRPLWGTGSKLSPAQRDALDDLGGAAEVAITAVTESRRAVALVGGADAVTAVWDLTTGERIGPFATDGERENGQFVRAAAPLTLDGRPYAVSVDPDGAVWLWNLTTGYRRHEPITRDLPASGVAVADPAGRPTLLLALANGTVAVIDVTTGSHTRTLRTGQDRAPGVLLAMRDTGGGWIATAGCADRTVLWHLETGLEIATVPEDPPSTVCAAPWPAADGRTLLLTGNGAELRCSTLEGEPLWSLQAPARSVAVTTLRDRPVAVVGGADGTLRLWDLLLREPLHRPWPVSREEVAAVAVAERSGRAVAVTADGEGAARLWDLETIAAIERPVFGHADNVVSLVSTVRSGEPVVFTGGDVADPVVRGWRLADGAEATARWDGHCGAVHALAVTEIEGVRLVIAGSDDGVRVHELDSGRPVGVLWERLVRSLAVGQVAPFGDRTVGVVGDGYGDWSVWDVLTGELLFEKSTGGELGIYALAIASTSDGDMVVTGDENGALLRWDLATGSALSEPSRVHEHPIDSLSIVRLHGELIAISGSRRENRVGITRLADGARLFDASVQRGGVLTVAAATLDGEPVALAGDRIGVHMWRLADGVALPSVAMPAPVNAVGIAGTGELIVGCGWDVVVMQPVDDRDGS